MELQYVIVAVVVLCFVLWQRKSYLEIRERIAHVKNLFPSDDEGNKVNKSDNTTTIERDDAEGDFKNTLDDINKYLSKNENKTFDYQIIKEIVERNVQSLENEVDTLLPSPLYLGLMATIFGIAVGVILFAWNDLASLIAGNVKSKGIQVLLTDVGIAMAASFVGVLSTKLLTSSFNDARTQMTRNKNLFLTWVQSDLMSKLNDDITGAILKMTADLNEFNRTFADNTKELRATLGTVNANYKEQEEILKTIRELNVTKITNANIKVYEKLKGCTNVLGDLFKILSDSASYVAKVKELNDNLADIDERTKLFEELGNYFKNELEYVKDRQGYMRQAVGELDSVMHDAFSDLGSSVNSSLQNLTTVFQAQNQRIEELIRTQQEGMERTLMEQQQAVNQTIGQIGNPFDGVKEIFEKGLGDIKEAFDKQNEAIKEGLKQQTEMLTESLKEQQTAILQKIKESPSELQSLSDIAKTLNVISQRLEANAKRKPAENGKPGEGKKGKKLYDRFAGIFRRK